MKYTSIFSPDTKVSAAQYIAELVCKNRSVSLNVELPTKFWDVPEWAKYYKAQIFICYQYLKKYDADTLIKVIKTKNIWSLSAKWINNEFQAEQNRQNTSKVVHKQTHVRVTDSTGVKNKKKDFGFLDG